MVACKKGSCWKVCLKDPDCSWSFMQVLLWQREGGTSSKTIDIEYLTSSAAQKCYVETKLSADFQVSSIRTVLVDCFLFTSSP